MDTIDIICDFMPFAQGREGTDFKCFNARKLAQQAFIQRGDYDMAQKISESDYSAKTIYGKIKEREAKERRDDVGSGILGMDEVNASE